MRILELNRWLAPGGGERFIVDLSNALTEYPENEVFVCTFVDEALCKEYSFYKKQLNSSIRYQNLKGTLSFYGKIRSLFTVFNYVRKIKPDVIHCHLQAYYYALLPLIFLKNVRVVNTLHNIAQKNIKKGLDKRLKSFFYRHGVQGVTISSVCYESFSSYMKFNNTVLIDNGCRDIWPTKKFNDVKDEIASFKIDNNTKVFVNVARVHPAKNHILLIKAFNRILTAGYNVTLLIIGAIHDYPEIKAELDKNISDSRIHFLGVKDNVQDYLFCSDAFCLSSKWEGAPISLLEAGFAGCYPLCTPVGGCKDTICNEEWGMLSKDLSVEEYSAMLKKFITMDKVPSREQIANLYKRKYSISNCASKYMQVFRGTL